MDEMEEYRERIERGQHDRRQKNGRRAADQVEAPESIRRGPFDLEFWLVFAALAVTGGWLAYAAYGANH